MNDLCVIIVSHNSRRWLDVALGSLFEHAEGLDLDVVLVDNGSDGSAAYVEKRFAQVRTISCPNHGFGHANNRALETANARYVLFLNPDTEFLTGDLGSLIAALDRRPDVALAGVRQVGSHGELAPSIRRFPSTANTFAGVGQVGSHGDLAPSIRRIPSTANTFAEALGVERVPGMRRVLGERELDPGQYGRETACDWTSGSFMIVRGAALERIGGFDERFFLFSEETDLCWRLKRAGWGVIHLPCVTIRHFEHDRWASPAMEAQAAYARMQFARKHFPRSALRYRRALGLHYGLRAALHTIPGRYHRQKREAARAALATVHNGRAPFVEQSAPRGSGGGMVLPAPRQRLGSRA